MDRQIIKVSPQPYIFLTPRPWPRFLIIPARKVGEILTFREGGPAAWLWRKKQTIQEAR